MHAVGDQNGYVHLHAGSNAFTVPAGVSSVHVEAVGGSGGNALGIQSGAGGHGALAVGDLTVSAGSTLFAVVGGNGGTRDFLSGDVGGSSGGGDSGFPFPAGGGGGASDVRRQGADLASRVLVAGGGGGGGPARPDIGPVPRGQGGNGGDAGAAGGNGGLRRK